MMNAMFGLFNLGGGEIILILALVLILFGARKLPELAKGLGQGIKEFKKATREVTDEVQRSVDESHYSPPASKQIEEPAQPPQPAQPAQPEKTAVAAQTTDHKG
jgi:sec-independent protein translocase protein TatA